MHSLQLTQSHQVGSYKKAELCRSSKPKLAPATCASLCIRELTLPLLLPSFLVLRATLLMHAHPQPVGLAKIFKHKINGIIYAADQGVHKQVRRWAGRR